MTLEEYIKLHKTNTMKKMSFVDYLYFLMNKYKIDNVTLYKKANISKQVFSNIISSKAKPSLNTILKIVFTLKLNNEECKLLLKKASFTLASSSNFSLIIRYCIENKIYDLYEVNNYLIKYGYEDKIII